MISRHSTDANLTEHEISVLRRREQHGWFVNRIAEDASGPGFAYSFGLYEEFGHPEIIICGLPEKTMHRLINDVGKQVRSGTKYSAGDRTSDLLEGYSCEFRAVSPLQYRKTCTWQCGFTEMPTSQPFNCGGPINRTDFRGSLISESNFEIDNQT